MTMHIPRTHLLDELYSFAARSSGVIIGSPGVGKTHTLKALCSRLIEESSPCLYLPIDKLAVSTDAALRSELGINQDFVTYLETIVAGSAASTGILLIDAFDAARSDIARSYFLSLIRRVHSRLQNTWSVIVSVRTYDAYKSEDLQDLFPNNRETQPDIQYQRQGIHCRHFFIPPLSEEERREAVYSIPPLIPVFENGSEDFLNLLRIPFNIWLLEKILAANPELPGLSSVSSEVQLLDLFWKQRVTEGSNSADKRQLLTKVTRAMVNERALSVREEDVYSLGGNEARQSLFSSEVLAEASSTAQRIAFSHNILFDFAVSILLMEDEPRKLIAFLNEDQSRPFFLRPSVNYYFTRLWHTTSDLFWASFWQFLPHKDLHLRLIAQLVPTTVIVKEARSIDQLTPLTDALRTSKPFAQDAVSRVLQALEASEVNRDELWILFLEGVSEHSDNSFIGLLSWHVSDILKRQLGREGSDQLVSKCGIIARRLLCWIWERRQEKVESFLDSIGSISLVPIVAQTFDTDAESSRACLEPVLSLTRETNYPIDYLYRLCHELDKVWPHDSEFAARTYDTVFSSYETSQEPTSMGTPVMPMRSNRRQDYEMCRYMLIQYFPQFLRSSAYAATKTAVTIINRSVLGDHVAPYLTEGVKLGELVKRFAFRGKEARYISDYSHIWGDQEYDDYLKLGNAVFEYVATLTSNPEIESLLDLFCDEVWVAYFWREILNVGARNPTTFAQYLSELCVASPIQTGNDTIRELGGFIEAAITEFTEDQRLTIEQSILSISEEDSEGKNRLEYERKRLLGRIPADLLRTDEGIALRTEMDSSNSVPRNEPLSTFQFSSKPYTEDDSLRERGVDLEKAENKLFRSLGAPLSEFERASQNQIPSAEAIHAILPAARALYAALQTESSADQAVIDSAWTTLASTAEAMSRGIKSAEGDEFGLCREILIRSSQHHLPEPDPEADAKFNMPSWSPYPRTEAAQGLPWLSTHVVDEELLQAIEALTHDTEPAVRFLVTGELFRLTVKAPEEFWRLANSLADNEKNGVVLYALCASVGRLISDNEGRATQLLQKLGPRVRGKYDYTEFMNYFVSVMMWLVFARQNEWAIKEAELYKANPSEFALQLHHAAFIALTGYITPVAESPAKREMADRAIEWLLDVLPNAGDSLRSLLEDLGKEPNEEKKQTIRNVYGVFDEIVTRLCFSADVIHHLRQEGNRVLSDEQRCAYYFKIKPLLEAVLSQTAEQKTSLLFASTAHRFMELLNGVMPCDPQGVLHMAAGVAKASEFDSFNLDAMATQDVVKLVEAILADHREAVIDQKPLQDLLSLLDTFAKAGWPAALRLVWRLDEIFR